MLRIAEEQSVIKVLDEDDARSYIGPNVLYQTYLADRCQMQVLCTPQSTYDIDILRKSVDEHLTSAMVV